MLLFESTDSVIDILWDVALACAVVRLALLYAALVAGSSLALSTLLHHLPFNLNFPPASSPEKASSSLKFPAHPLPLIVLALSALWSRVLIQRCEVPRAAGLRLAVGGAAAAVVMLAEGLVGLVWCEVLGGKGLGEWMMGGWERWLAVMGGFALMPVVWMAVEGRGLGEGGKGGGVLGLGGGRGRGEEGEKRSAVPSIRVSDQKVHG